MRTLSSRQQDWLRQEREVFEAVMEETEKYEQEALQRRYAELERLCEELQIKSVSQQVYDLHQEWTTITKSWRAERRRLTTPDPMELSFAERQHRLSWSGDLWICATLNYVQAVRATGRGMIMERIFDEANANPRPNARREAVLTRIAQRCHELYCETEEGQMTAIGRWQNNHDNSRARYEKFGE